MLLRYTFIPVITKVCPHVLISVSGKIKSAVILSPKNCHLIRILNYKKQRRRHIEKYGTKETIKYTI